MQSLFSVLGNSLEDTTDDLISTVIYSEQKRINNALVNHNDNLSLIEEAINNFITQTLFGLAFWGYSHIMPFIEKIIARLGLEWGYIVTGKLKKKISNLKTKNIKGKKALNLIGAIIGSDKTLERIEVVKLADSKVRQIDKRMETFKADKLAIEGKFLKLGATSAQIKGVSSQENFNLYMHKTKTSTWQKTATDKKLFEKITGEKIATTSPTSWSDLVDTLNQYSEFAKDSENKIYNLTEAILKVINRANVAK